MTLVVFLLFFHSLPQCETIFFLWNTAGLTSLPYWVLCIVLGLLEFCCYLRFPHKLEMLLFWNIRRLLLQ